MEQITYSRIVTGEERSITIITGPVLVKAGGKLQSFGILSGDVFVEAGGVFENYGTMKGNVFGTGSVRIGGVFRGEIAGTLQKLD